MGMSAPVFRCSSMGRKEGLTVEEIWKLYDQAFRPDHDPESVYYVVLDRWVSAKDPLTEEEFQKVYGKPSERAA